MASAAPHNAYAELFEQLDALTSRGFGTWCAQALGDEVVYAVDIDWYRAGAQVSEVLAQAGTGAAAERVRDELESFLGDYFTVRRRSASPEQVLCGSMADDAEFRPRALTGSAAACLLFLEHGGCDPWSAADEPAGIEDSTPDTREPDPELLRRQIGMLCLQYAVLENESALLRSTCIKMGSYDQRGGIDPATLAFIDRGDWDAFQPIVRNRNFAKTQRRIGTLLDAPGYSESSDAELPLAESQLGSIPSTPKPANRKAGADWVKYLAKRTFFTAIEGNVDILAGQVGATPARRVELARTGWLWKFTQGRAEDASARRAPIAADGSAAWQQAGQLLARWIWECSTATKPGGTIHAVDDATLALAAAADGNENGLVEFRLLRQALRRGLGKACWMFNWLQKKSGRTDRGVFVREQASYIVNHYLGRSSPPCCTASPTTWNSTVPAWVPPPPSRDSAAYRLSRQQAAPPCPPGSTARSRSRFPSHPPATARYPAARHFGRRCPSTAVARAAWAATRARSIRPRMAQASKPLSSAAPISVGRRSTCAYARMARYAQPFATPPARGSRTATLPAANRPTFTPASTSLSPATTWAT